MCKWLTMVATILLASTIQAGDPNAEALVKEYLKTTKDAVKTLSAIKNQTTAEAAKIKLDDLSRKLVDIDKKRDNLAKTSAKVVEGLQKKYEKQLQGVDDDLSKEFLRLEKLPATWPALQKTLFGPLILARFAETRQHVAQLTEAVQTYKAAYNEYPASLDALAKMQGKDNALVDAKALVDLWGRPYQYDVKGPRNKGALPDLWSQGPAPGDPASVIGNWSLDAKTEPKKSL